MYLIFKVIFLSIFSFSLLGQDVVCPEKLDEPAKELVVREMTGIRIDGFFSSTVCSKDKFRFNIVNESDYPNDNTMMEKYIVSSPDDIKIKEIKLIDKSVREYLIKYEFKAKDISSKKAVTLEDSITLMQEVSKKVQKETGCVSLLRPPKHAAVFERCLEKVPVKK